MKCWEAELMSILTKYRTRGGVTFYDRTVNHSWADLYRTARQERRNYEFLFLWNGTWRSVL